MSAAGIRAYRWLAHSSTVHPNEPTIALTLSRRRVTPATSAASVGTHHLLITHQTFPAVITQACAVAVLTRAVPTTEGHIRTQHWAVAALSLKALLTHAFPVFTSDAMSAAGIWTQLKLGHLTRVTRIPVSTSAFPRAASAPSRAHPQPHVHTRIAFSTRLFGRSPRWSRAGHISR